MAIEYCKRHNLRLIDTYLDAGLSAYNGQNLSDGAALKMLLDAVRAGQCAPGTHLIVESLHRLSRSEIPMAVRLFLDILEMGLVIVTLIDREQVFTKERADSDMTALISQLSSCLVPIMSPETGARASLKPAKTL